MKIAIPSESKVVKDKIFEHFGRCPDYTILNEKGELVDILENTSSHRGGSLLPPDFLKQNQVDVLLCHGIGHKALQMCQNLQIEVYVDYASSTVEEIFQKWQTQKLKKAALKDNCREHQ